MKSLLIITFCFLLSGQVIYGQKYITKTATIEFGASVPFFEEVEATNDKVSAIFNLATGEFAALALMKGFRFKIALMEEHFNENYVESSEFPKAIFRGTINNFDSSLVTETFQNFELVGVINMHGTDKNVELPMNIRMDDGIYYITTDFILKPEDFNIDIPNIVSNKIAEDINVNASFMLKSK